MLISIIIPTIGRSTLESVLRGISECEDFAEISPEVIVVFDGMSRDLKFQSDHIKTFKTQTKVFSGGARNLGIEKSQGDIIAFLGDDTVPDKKWLQSVYRFHQENQSAKKGLLGKISWVSDLAQDPFHQWLETHAQFDFQRLKKQKPTWRHFYTSNISVKKSMIGGDRFSSEFVGWGFEDSEFGYRLAQKGFELIYNPQCVVFHDHKQIPQKVWEQTQNARKNAFVFERLHPELSIVPRGRKKIFLKMILFLALALVPFSPQVRWWRKWKKAWLGL